MNFEIKKGDKVIRSDGLCGKVSLAHSDGTASVKFENGETGLIREDLLMNYYLIGKNVIGNKISENDLKQKIDFQREICKKENEKLDQLRKQLWYLQNRMLPDWKEHGKQNTK